MSDYTKETKAEKAKKKKNTLSGMSYAASGFAMSCSYFMLAQMLHTDSVNFGSEYIAYLWPAALLGGSFVSARLWGHFHARDLIKGKTVSAIGFVFLEGVSVYTSFYSALTSVAATDVMSSGKQIFWALLVAFSLSVIAIVPAIGIQMMKEKGGSSNGKKSSAARHLRAVQ